MPTRASLPDAPSPRNLLTCGTFRRGDAGYIIDTVRSLGLSLDEEGSIGTVIPDPTGGFRLEARGPAVRGYLLAEDGEEAELQDIRRLVLACARPGDEVRFSGTCQLCPEKLLVISSRAVHDGRFVRWSSTRTVIGPLGEVRTLRDEDI